MSGAQFQVLASKRWLAGTSTQTGAATTTTGFAGTFIIFDRTISVANGATIYSVGGLFLNAIANMTYYIALENSSTSMTIVAEIAQAHPGGNVWSDGVFPWPYKIPDSGTYRIGIFATLGTEDFNNTGTRTSKTTASDPGLTTVTGLANATDGTINLRYTLAA